MKQYIGSNRTTTGISNLTTDSISLDILGNILYTDTNGDINGVANTTNGFLNNNGGSYSFQQISASNINFGLNNNIVPITNNNGYLANSSTTSTQLSFLNNCTSDINTNLNNLSSSINYVNNNVNSLINGSTNFNNVQLSGIVNKVLYLDTNNLIKNTNTTASQISLINNCTSDIQNQLNNLNSSISYVNNEVNQLLNGSFNFNIINTSILNASIITTNNFNSNNSSIINLYNVNILSSSITCQNLFTNFITSSQITINNLLSNSASIPILFSASISASNIKTNFLTANIINTSVLHASGGITTNNFSDSDAAIFNFGCTSSNLKLNLTNKFYIGNGSIYFDNVGNFCTETIYDISWQNSISIDASNIYFNNLTSNFNASGNYLITSKGTNNSIINNTNIYIDGSNILTTAKDFKILNYNSQ